MVPTDRKYTTTHEWVLVTSNEVTIGISDHAQDSLGDITFIEFPAVGATIVREKECGVIESVKAASDLYAPVSGTVTAVNNNLETAPEVINSDPYHEGWILKLKDVAPAEIDLLMNAAAYEAFLESDQ